MSRVQAAFSPGGGEGSLAGVSGTRVLQGAAAALAARRSTSATRRRASAAPAPAGTNTTRTASRALRATGHLPFGFLGRFAP